MPGITIDIAQDRGAYVIRVGGELDLSGSARLALALAKAEHAQTDRIHLDLKEVTFIDSSGLETVAKASRRSANNGNRLEITRSNGVVADMFRVSALDATLPLTDPPRAIPQARRSRSQSSMRTESHRDERDRQLDRKMRELLVFRDAGLLTESELEEQKVKLHWGLV